MTAPSLHRYGFLALLVTLTACQSLPSATTDEDTELPGDRPGDLYVNLGLAYMREGRYKIALRKLQRGLDKDPDNPNLYSALGLLYQKLGEDQKAAASYARAVDLAPRDSYIRNARGSFLCQKGQYAAADAEFRKALANPLYSTPWIALTNAGICARQAGRFDEAETYLRRALGRNPAFPLALEAMARVRYLQGAYEDARRYLQRLRKLRPLGPEALWLEIQTAYRLGDLQTLYQTRLELERRYPDAPEVQRARELTRRR